MEQINAEPPKENPRPLTPYQQRERIWDIFGIEESERVKRRNEPI